MRGDSRIGDWRHATLAAALLTVTALARLPTRFNEASRQDQLQRLPAPSRPPDTGDPVALRLDRAPATN